MKDERDQESSRNAELIEEGSRVAFALAGRRSEKLLRLFNFLLEQSQQGRQPGEAEIAAAVRGDQEPGKKLPGSSIRVYVSRLRKMLDQYYAARPGPRLVIPHGEYCVELVTPDRKVPDPAEACEAGSTADAPVERTRMRQTGGLLFAAIVGVNLIIACAFWMVGSRGASDLDKTKFWQPVASSRYPTAIVVGDYFLFGERHSGKLDQIVRDLAIRNREDYRHHISQGGHPDGSVDLDLAYVSSNVVFALRSLWIAIEGLNLRQPPVSAIPASRLDPDIFNGNNIVYTGPLDGLGRLLDNALSRASGFIVDAGEQQLIDRNSHRHYRSDLATVADVDIPLSDYGYIASLPGPSGKRILIISGLGDAGIAQMAELASSRTGLAELASKIGGNGDSFEALYRVRAMYSQSYGRKLILARAISDQGIWDMPARAEEGK